MKVKRHAIAWVVAVVAAGCAAAPKPAPTPNPIFGCWRNDDDRDLTWSLLRFESAKCATFRLGSYQAYPASYEPGEVRLRSWGKKLSLIVTIAGNGRLLTVADGAGVHRYHKLESVPPELDPKPIVLGEAIAVSSDRVAAIQAELAQRRGQDQAVRKDPGATSTLLVDADNTSWLRSLVVEIGWIDADRFGAGASNAAFLIVQHSGDVPLMMAALPCIESELKRKLVDPQDYALLYDRLQVNLGEKQRYGSQLGQADGGYWVVMPLEDRSRVDEFRREIGLFTFGEYLDFMRANTPMKDVRFEN